MEIVATLRRDDDEVMTGLHAVRRVLRSRYHTVVEAGVRPVRLSLVRCGRDVLVSMF